MYRKIVYGVGLVVILISFIYGLTISPATENPIQDNFEAAVDRDGNLLYRPYWLVGSYWDELEKNGQIVTSYKCLDLVKTINQNEDQVNIDPVFNEWKLNCIMK